MPRLRSLSLAHNALPQLPEGLWRLREIEELDLSHNRLSNLPPAVSQLPRLSKLLLACNQLRANAPPEGGLVPMWTADW